ncbi:MAG TPA: HesA/MoeB/ThiF family protein [Bryobacteraceae bacterium]|nr:HesA/MoeB/ThiF family protein [Bryobacteraceae bacterium]
MSLSAEQRDRYARHLTLPEIGAAGQERLLASRVLVIGAGGLGSPAAFYLAAAGVGTLGILDHDRVEPSNLQRQILHRTADVGRAKTDSAVEKIAALNPEVTVRTVSQRLEESNAVELVSPWDFAIDATDNFAAKFLIADACHAAARPYSHAGIARFFGQTMTVIPGETACYRCVFDQAPPPDERDANPAGPLGAVPAVIGSIQATEAIKRILGIGRLLTNRLLTYDALGMRFREVPAPRNPDCRLCGGST